MVYKICLQYNLKPKILINRANNKRNSHINGMRLFRYLRKLWLKIWKGFSKLFEKKNNRDLNLLNMTKKAVKVKRHITENHYIGTILAYELTPNSNSFEIIDTPFLDGFQILGFNGHPNELINQLVILDVTSENPLVGNYRGISLNNVTLLIGNH